MKNILPKFNKPNLVIILVCMICFCYKSYAQPKTFCGLDEILRNQNSFREAGYTASATEVNTSTAQKNGAVDVIYLNTVVHILYNNPSENLDDSEIIDLINDLNEIYRKEINLNLILPELQPIAADSRIQLCLTKVDTNGNPTNGINHIETNVSAFTSDLSDEEPIKTSSLGGASPWDTDQYLNIWIGQADGPGVIVSWGVPDTSYLPLGPDLASLFGGQQYTKGVVLDIDTFDPTFPVPAANTLAHELGHALGLKHTHGDPPGPTAICDFDDEIDDTPLCGIPFDACGTSNINSCIESVDDKPDNLSNIMFYDCAVMISMQQAERMYLNLTELGSPGFVLTEAECNEILLSADFDALNTRTMCSDGAIDFDYLGTGATSWEWTFEGGTPSSSTEENPVITYTQPGTYNVELTISNGTDQNTVTKTDFITVLPQPTAVITQNNPASSSGATDGSLQAEVFDGVPPYTFELLPNNIINTTGLFENLAVGDYSVAIYNDDSQCYVEIPVTVDLLTATDELNQQLTHLNISPNPNNGKFELSIAVPFPEEVELSLLDVMGHVLKNESVPAQQIYLQTWELMDLPAGIYFLKGQTQGVFFGRKIVIR